MDRLGMTKTHNLHAHEVSAPNGCTGHFNFL